MMRSNRRTFVDIVIALSDDGNEIWIHVFVQNRSIVENTALRMHMLDGIFRCDGNDFL